VTTQESAHPKEGFAPLLHASIMLVCFVREELFAFLTLLAMVSRWPITNDLIYEVLKLIQADVAEPKQVGQEMSKGLSSIRSDMNGIGDVFSDERRFLTIEGEIIRLKNRLGPAGHHY